MKTTVEIPDKLFKDAKAAAIRRGQSLKAFLTEALQERVSAPRRPPAGWPVPPPKLNQGEMSQIEAMMAGEFSRIDPRDWQ